MNYVRGNGPSEYTKEGRTTLTIRKFKKFMEKFESFWGFLIVFSITVAYFYYISDRSGWSIAGAILRGIGSLISYGLLLWAANFIGETVISFICFVIPLKQPDPPQGINIYIGESTGTLADRNHYAGLSYGQKVYLELPDLCQNIITFGGIGSGKTTRVIQPFMSQLMKQDCGGLIFDIKGDFGLAAKQIAAAANNRQIKTIGVDGLGVNLLSGLEPEMAATFLKSSFYLTGGQTGESFWIDTATELCKNALGVLSFLPEHYSLLGLYDYCFDDERRIELTEAAREKALTSERNARLFNIYSKYYDQVFCKFDDKVIQGVKASVSQVLSPFQHPDLIDTFCISEASADLETVLDGDLYLVDLPLSRWGLAGKVVYTFIKLRFFNIIQSRPNNPKLNQDRPVLFICDEYQEIISASRVGLSDLNFWDKARSARCVGMISSQSISSFRAAIGDDILSDAILQNFRGAKIFFRSEDQATIDYINSVAGVAEVERVTKGSGFGHDSTSWQERATVDAQLLRTLGPNQAIAFCNLSGRAYDDILTMSPLFV